MVSRVAVWGRAELGGWSSGRGQFVGYRFWGYCSFTRCHSFFDFSYKIWKIEMKLIKTSMYGKYQIYNAKALLNAFSSPVEILPQ